MFRFSALLGLVLVVVLVSSFKNMAIGDNASSAWLSSTLDLNVSSLPSLDGVQSGNIDCFFDHSTCAYSTSYGLADTTGAVELNGSSGFSPVVGHMDARRHFFAIPGSNMAITYTTDPVYGAYVYFNYSFTSAVTRIEDPGAGAYYYMNQPPDAKLTDISGHAIAVDLTSAGFSQNGGWMIVSAPNLAMLRVNLRTFEVLPFAPGFSYGIGLSPAPVTAITNDGRYAVFASKDFNRFAIYDLNTCGAIPSTITGPVNCQSLDLQNYMNSKLSGFTVPSGPRFLNDDTLSFYTRYGSSSPLQSARIILRDISGPVNQQDYLALGDSYISGEGAFQYLPGTDTDHNQCHVSQVSYPLLIGAELNYNSYHSVACSGATTDDIINVSNQYAGQVKNGADKDEINKSGGFGSILSNFQQGYIDQLDFVQQYQPKAITLSIGGNDIGFSARLQQCLGGGTCYNTYEERLEFVQEVNQAFPKLLDTYSKLKNAGPDNMRIYVIGYPQIAKADGDCALNVHMNQAELQFAEQAINYLDTVIQAAAAKTGVYYVDTKDALDGHRLCEAKPGSIAVNGITAGNDFPDWLGGPIGRESYHPNDFGHLLMENRVLAATRNLTVSMPAPNQNAAPPAETGLSILDIAHSGQAIKTTEYDGNMTGDYIYRGTPAQISINGSAHALASNTTVQAQLHSDPIDLGSFTTDVGGSLTVSLLIPSSTPAGYHTLHFYGSDISGQPIDIFKTIYVAATADDTDGNGISDSLQKCVGVAASNVDSDLDGIDDSCDDLIELPTPDISTSPSSVNVIAAVQPLVFNSNSPASDDFSNSTAPSNPQVLAAASYSPTNSVHHYESLGIPAGYYLGAGFGFLALATLSYVFKIKL